MEENIIKMLDEKLNTILLDNATIMLVLYSIGRGKELDDDKKDLMRELTTKSANLSETKIIP